VFTQILSKNPKGPIFKGVNQKDCLEIFSSKLSQSMRRIFMAITLTKLATKAIEKVQQLMPPVDFQQSHQVMPLTIVGLDSS
jgi:hypothetical protein